MLINSRQPLKYHPIVALESRLKALQESLSDESGKAFIDPMRVEEYIDKLLFLEEEIKRTRSALRLMKRVRYGKYNHSSHHFCIGRKINDRKRD